MCLFYISFTYPLQREERSYADIKVHLSHSKWPAPANSLVMYNSVSVVNLHNASTADQALCYSKISRGKSYRTVDDLSGNSGLSKHIQTTKGKAE